MKCFLPVALVMSLILAFSLAPRNSEADESETAPSSAEFEDKIVTVYIDGPEKRAG